MYEGADQEKAYKKRKNTLEGETIMEHCPRSTRVTETKGGTTTGKGEGWLCRSWSKGSTVWAEVLSDQ